MKKIYILLIAMLFAFTLSSCSFETYATTQDDVYTEYVNDVVYSNVDVNLVIRYGNPYYYNGSILYYLYNGIYYYPYYYNNYWYFRAYRRPFAHINYHPYFRPHRYDYRFDRGYRRPHNWYRYTPSSQHNRHIQQPTYRPTPNINGSHSRPNTNMRPHNNPSTSRPNITPGRSIGGSRGGHMGRGR